MPPPNQTSPGARRALRQGDGEGSGAVLVPGLAPPSLEATQDLFLRPAFGGPPGGVILGELGVDYVYVRTDGIHVNIRLEEHELCLLVMIGVRADARS